MTQKGRVLSMLKAAGPRGVRSDAFLDVHIPRAAARILELRSEGLEITSEREKQFVRYCLPKLDRPGGSLPLSSANGAGQPVGVDSGDELPGGPLTPPLGGSPACLPGLDAPPSNYDPYSEAA